MRPNTVFGRGDVCGVGDDVGMRRIEHARCRIDEIAALGDGQRDDADRRIGKLRDDGAGIARHQEVDHDAGHARLHVAAVLLDHGGQPVLLLELLAADLLAVEHAGADQRPVMVAAGVEEVVEIDRLMRAMEIADAEMQDAGAQGAALVGGRGHVAGKFAKRCWTTV